MKEYTLLTMNSDIQAKFTSYPEPARRVLENVRRLILSVAAEKGLGPVEESMKWGEASYRVKGGTPLRIDWKPDQPDRINVYFHCQTRLIETFREIYPQAFDYEGRRALLIPLDSNIDHLPLAHCIELALKYRTLKHLPMLGV